MNRSKSAKTGYYPVFDMDSIVDETKDWYRALGIKMNCKNLTTLVRIANGFSGLVLSIYESLGLSSNFKVATDVVDTPSVAFMRLNENGSRTVCVSSWVFDRAILSKWIPEVKSMSEEDVFAVSVGIINGALALDILSQECKVRNHISSIQDEINTMCRDYIAFDGINVSSLEPTDEFVFTLNAIRDLMMLKYASSLDNNGWIRFPILMMRMFFDDAQINEYVKRLLDKDCLKNFIPLLASLKCFTSAAEDALLIRSFGPASTRILLQHPFTMDTARFMTRSIIENYFSECFVEKKRNGSGEGEGGDGEENSGDKKQGSEPQSKGSDKKINKSSAEFAPISDMKRTEPESTAPINADIKKAMVKAMEEKLGDGADKIMKDGGVNKTEVSMGDPNKETDFNDPAEFMRAFFGHGKPTHKKVDDEPADTRTFQSIDEYIKEYAPYKGPHRTTYQEWSNNIKNIFDNIDKTSLRNLFMAKTMDVEKSQPCRSGITIIPTRIANIFTDEKLFSPLPEEETERESEIIILLDGSGSMRSWEDPKINGVRQRMPHVNLVAGVSYAILNGLIASNIRTQVFIHSTKDYKISVPGEEYARYKEGCMLVKVCDSNDTNQLEKFEKAYLFDNENNIDGYAIDAVVENFDFDGSNSTKTLIVLSDGSPAGHCYNRKSGVEHTKEMVKKAEENGVSVYSVSLNTSCEEDNDKIYGSERNIKLGETDINKMLSKIVEVVSKESMRSANNVLTQG